MVWCFEGDAPPHKFLASEYLAPTIRKCVPGVMECFLWGFKSLLTFLVNSLCFLFAVWGMSSQLSLLPCGPPMLPAIKGPNPPSIRCLIMAFYHSNRIVMNTQVLYPPCHLLSPRKASSFQNPIYFHIHPHWPPLPLPHPVPSFLEAIFPPSHHIHRCVHIQLDLHYLLFRHVQTCNIIYKVHTQEVCDRVTKSQKTIWSEFTILCWAAFAAVLGHTWPRGHELDISGETYASLTSLSSL